jgi:hypothetical protein
MQHGSFQIVKLESKTICQLIPTFQADLSQTCAGDSLVRPPGDLQSSEFHCVREYYCASEQATSLKNSPNISCWLAFLLILEFSFQNVGDRL